MKKTAIPKYISEQIDEHMPPNMWIERCDYFVDSGNVRVTVEVMYNGRFFLKTYYHHYTFWQRLLGRQLEIMFKSDYNILISHLTNNKKGRNNAKDKEK